MFLVYVVLCLIVFGCQYQCNWLPGKARLRNDLLCVEWDVKPYTLTHSLSSHCSCKYFLGLMYISDLVSTLKSVASCPLEWQGALPVDVGMSACVSSSKFRHVVFFWLCTCIGKLCCSLYLAKQKLVTLKIAVFRFWQFWQRNLVFSLRRLSSHHYSNVTNKKLCYCRDSAQCAKRPFKVIQGHLSLCQGTQHIWLPISTQ